MVTKVKDMSPKQRRGFFASIRGGQEKIRQAGVRFREAREAKLERQIVKEEEREKVLEERLGRRQRLEEARASRLEAVQSRKQKLAELKGRERKARRELFRLSPTGKAVRAAKRVGVTAIAIEQRIERQVKARAKARAKAARPKRAKPQFRAIRVRVPLKRKKPQFRTITRQIRIKTKRKPRKKREETFSDFL